MTGFAADVESDNIYEIPSPDGDVVLVGDTQNRTRAEVHDLVQIVINSLDSVTQDEYDLVNSLSRMGFISIEPITLRVSWKERFFSWEEERKASSQSASASRGSR